MEVRTSRRPRLWEMEHKCHCPLVGVCFDMPEMRKLVGKVMHLPRDYADFEIHSTAVKECGSHTRLAGLLHKELERKYGLYVQQYKAVKDAEGLYALWCKAVDEGNIAGPLWAILSHARCNEALSHVIYSDVHMLQHQVGAGHRIEQRALLQLRQENAALGREMAGIQQRFTQYRDARVTEIAELKTQLTEMKAELVRHQSLAEQAASKLESLRPIEEDLDSRMLLNERLARSEAEAGELRAQLAQAVRELQQAMSDNRRLEQELARLSGEQSEVEAEAERPMREVKLNGCTVLCVGGLGSATARYRHLVEQRGGAFLHHDGGTEENLRRLENVIGTADAVICQTGCISHNAYWRVKDQCKRTGKPCTFVENPSLSSFLRVLDSLEIKSPAE